MSSQETGGPAFPIIGMQNRNGQQIEFVHSAGMDLRDYFAAKAMQAYVSDHPGAYLNYDEVANAAYQQADAMLKARMK